LAKGNGEHEEKYADSRYFEDQFGWIKTLNNEGRNGIALKI